MNNSVHVPCVRGNKTHKKRDKWTDCLHNVLENENIMVKKMRYKRNETNNNNNIKIIIIEKIIITMINNTLIKLSLTTDEFENL